MSSLDHLYDGYIDAPSMDLGCDFPREEYELRLGKARALMLQQGLEALIVCSSSNGAYFTSRDQPRKWHDRVQTRAAFFVLTIDSDYLYLTPTHGGENQNTARKRTWVTNIRSVVERHEDRDRVEQWGVEWMVKAFKELKLDTAKLGWELGDCQTLGISYNDFNEFKRLMPGAQFVDGSRVLRRLHQFPTPFQLDVIRKACCVGVKMHDQVPEIVKIGMTEKEFAGRMRRRFEELNLGEGYSFAGGYDDVRNPKHPEMNLMFKGQITGRPFMEGDVFCRGSSGISYLGQGADIDRVWYVGSKPPAIVKRWYAVTHMCLDAMAAALKPGDSCADVFAVRDKIAKENGLPQQLVGRNGHWSDLSGLSIHPDCDVALEPGMVISCEPTFVSDYGYFDIEDIFLITEDGCERLHKGAPAEIPCCGL